MKNRDAIILLSGGLDSLVSVAIMQKNYNIKKALHFNYGQKPKEKELKACKNICEYYKIDMETIDINWLAQISEKSALSDSNEDFSNIGKDYWIPNRNGLFVNIGACFAEALDCKYVAIGANLEEATGFKDNSTGFIKATTSLFGYSTQNNVELIAPLINMDKNEIIKTAIELNAPLNMVWSCYYEGEKHCGQCPSCKLLKSALEKNNRQDLQKILF